MNWPLVGFWKKGAWTPVITTRIYMYMFGLFVCFPNKSTAYVIVLPLLKALLYWKTGVCCFYGSIVTC